MKKHSQVDEERVEQAFKLLFTVLICLAVMFALIIGILWSIPFIPTALQ